VTKAELRREGRVRLAALSPYEKAAASAAIGRLVWDVDEVAGARTLLLFAGRGDEVETDGIAGEAVRRGVRLVYPLCDPATGRLTLHAPEATADLVPGSFGIREPDPVTSHPVEPGEVDVALVPGLAWDRPGGRLGRGAGFFDRLFADPAWRGFRCGIFFAVQEMANLPLDPWDAPLHAVVTEREIWRP
jgi:5-formyltetrahydrofolate cyclo-ligase